jgi:hypothetical protein
MGGLDQFEKEYPAQLEKIRNAPHITTAQKRAFIRHLQIWKGRRPISEHADAFFRAKQQAGPRVSLKRREVLGHARKKTSLLLHLNRVIGLSKREAQLQLDEWLAMAEGRRLDEIKAYLGSHRISSYMMWSFRNRRTPRQPLDGIDLALLPCRLGLEDNQPELFLFIGYEPSDSIIAHAPTAFDPGTRNLSSWQSGGTTHPKPACRAKYRVGLPEVVHDPVQFDALQAFRGDR